MKNTILILVLIFSTWNVQAQSKKIDTDKSNIEWKGKKLTGSHEGMLKFSEGTILFENDKLKGGKFIVDMKSINTTDLKGDGKDGLDEHLKSEDFFGVEKYPTADLVMKKIADKGNGIFTVTADLTIKSKTHPVTFDLKVSKNSATTNFSVDRTKYDITYKSGSVFDGLGDKAIYDDFDLEVKLVYRESIQN